MKTYCQNCSNPLAENISICPKCGFENKIINIGKNRKKYAIYFLVPFFIIAAALLFYDQFSNYYYNQFRYGLNSAINGDATKKDEFARVFGNYNISRLTSLTQHGFNEYTEYNPAINKIIETGKDSRLRMLSKPESEILQKTPGKLNLALFYCNDNEENFNKCKEYYNKITRNRLSEKCLDCSENISELYKTVAALKNKDDASKLIKLVDSLRSLQTIYDSDELIKLPDLIFEKIYCTANQGNIMAQGENSPEYAGMLNHLVSREKCFKDINDYVGQYEAIVKELNENITAINDYIAILNGDMGLNLSNLD